MAERSRHLSRARALVAALALGAEGINMGTRFIDTTEAMAADAYKQMVIDSGSTDIVHTPAVSGVPASFMRQISATAPATAIST